MGAGWPLFNGSRAPGPSAGLDGQAKLGESPAPTRARWRSGYAEDCKSLHAGSIPARASTLTGRWQSEVTEKAPPKRTLRQVRLLLWLLVGLTVIATAALWLIPQEQTKAPEAAAGPVKASFGGPFTLVGGDGKPFSS